MKTCFVIMPFSKSHELRDEGYWTNHFESFLKPTIESVGDIVVTRSEILRGNIMKDILHSLMTSDIVVADLTDANPNVYYELGIRQSFKHGTITIAQEGTYLPFDINHKGTLIYRLSDGLAGTKNFEITLQTAIKHCVEKPNEPDSDILEYISGKNSVYYIINKEIIKRKLHGLHLEYIHNNMYISKISEDSLFKVDLENYSLFSMEIKTDNILSLINEQYLEMSNDSIEIIYNYYNNIKYLNTTIEKLDLINTMGSVNTEFFNSNNIFNQTKFTLNYKEAIDDLIKKTLEHHAKYALELAYIINSNNIEYNPFEEYIKDLIKDTDDKEAVKRIHKKINPKKNNS